ncbi:hypothetical protein THTE_2654 [Thermogutta terrifontis]|uniref:Uncharacterized protein n=1 Tax=Thermogutta terrifontis TaxID=1331910 RepID=A0A286RH46_9BACT|nr:hypothetical protein [Thermogutta terrifontis]ASV75256.1 hypothetical protein THTE_2654 [Thermogutta terrifontis]
MFRCIAATNRVAGQSSEATVKNFYLGKHGTPESRAEFERLIAEWLTAGRVRLNRLAHLTTEHLLRSWMELVAR